MAKEDKLITEAQLRNILLDVLTTLNIHEDNTISKDFLLYDICKLKKTVDKLDIVTRNIVEYSTYSNIFYIPVNDQNNNKSPFDITFNINTMTQGLTLGVYIPANFSSSMSSKPVVKYMSKDCRGVLTKFKVEYVEISKASSLWAKEYFYKIELLNNTINVTDMNVDISNHLGYTNMVNDILNGEGSGSYAINTIKSVEVDSETKVGFDDIPSRNELLRSKTASYYEIVSQDEYELMEAQGTISNSTVYSIPEKYQITE